MPIATELLAAINGDPPATTSLSTCKIYLGMRPGDRWLQHGLEERLRVLYYRLVPARRRVAGKCSFRVSQEVQARQAGGVSDC